jgi:polyhydroxyalkanoate synthase
VVAEPVADMVKTFSKLTEYWLSDPARALEAQTRLFSGYMAVWTNSLRRLGEGGEAAAEDGVKPDKGDKRFQDPEWGKNAFFDFLKQTYLVTARWASDLVEHAEGLDEHTKHKATFYVRQVANAISPSNFILTNPELFRETVASNGENLVAGMKMLAEDIAAGRGELRLRQADYSKFAIGKNLAMTPGKVVARGELAEIIQYEPATEKVLRRPLLICPPWINKYYILDLNPQKSFIRWAVEQGHTVFVISWVNPDERHGRKDWDAYVEEGLRFALDTIEEETGERQVNAVGYCVGGTLLAAALALFAQAGDDRINAGDLKVFVDEDQITALEKSMNETGFLEGNKMATAFNMLRSGDLIWPYVVNNYMLGKKPFPFDLLYWNQDSTRMAAANHKFYLREFYNENRLAKGEMEIGGIKLDLKKIKLPIFSVATRDDHIAPAASVFQGMQMLGGPVEFVLAGSGHIAGVINPPTKAKYQYWTKGTKITNLADWQASATASPGSWWPYWIEWLSQQSGGWIESRTPGAKLGVIEDAPGSYVKAR